MKGIKGGFTAEPWYAFDKIMGFSVYWAGELAAEFGLRDIDSLNIFDYSRPSSTSDEYITEFYTLAWRNKNDRDAWWESFDRFA